MQTNTAPSATSQVPELGHLKAAAERVGQCNYNVQAFLSRFFGATPEGASGGKDEAASCYRNDMNGLFEAITELERLVGNLANIG